MRAFLSCGIHDLGLEHLRRTRDKDVIHLCPAVLVVFPEMQGASCFDLRVQRLVGIEQCARPRALTSREKIHGGIAFRGIEVA